MLKKLFISLKTFLKNNKIVWNLLKFIYFRIYVEYYKKYLGFFKRKEYDGIQGKKIIFFILSADQNNVGDHAISYATIKWLKQQFSEYYIMEICNGEYYSKYFAIKRKITSKDLIFLQGGGNIGERYFFCEHARQDIIKRFKNNRIISMPQTISFSKSSKGMRELRRAKVVYNKHKYLTIITRDDFSYRFSKLNFPNCNILCIPDIVLSLEFVNNYLQRDGILLCLRNDTETIYGSFDRNKIKEAVNKFECSLTEQDTCTGDKILPFEREKIINYYLQLFSKHKLVITDRYHGLIFSVLTRTPCIALKTIDHKISQGIKWFSNIETVFFCDNIESIGEYIIKAMNIKQSSVCSNKIFKELFVDLKKYLK